MASTADSSSPKITVTAEVSEVISTNIPVSLKRPRNEEPFVEHKDVGNESGKKARKLFPIFSKGPSSQGGADLGASQNPSFKWHPPPRGRGKTCLHGENNSEGADLVLKSKLAIFDLDGTLIKSRFGNGSQGHGQSSYRGKGKGRETQDEMHWEWWHSVVPTKLRQIRDEGYSIVLVTNQGIKPAALEKWKKKIPNFASAIPDIPFRILAATSKDQYRKPIPGMWWELEKLWASRGVEISKDNCFFVGDAAGRQHDFAGTDRKWALNVGIPFFTPEEYFLNFQPAPFKLQGFHVSSLPQHSTHFTPDSTPVVPPAPNQPEIVLFVGYPGVGKSTIYRTHFAPAGYRHVNQDTLGTRGKCISSVKDALENRISCVVDNTNRDVKTRKHYIDLAASYDINIRCFQFDGSVELAWHNNLYRALCQPEREGSTESKRDLVPYVAFPSYRDSYEPPTMEEGFSEIKTVHWIFEGTDEERKLWNMWLQLDGK